MPSQIEQLRTAIEPLRQEIINHKVYPVIRSLPDLRVFTQHHVYAVWDFMSLLKTLQNALTCTSVPWFPKGSADTRYLINEIVIGEESDVDAAGIRKSHFELYLEAMEECGADTASIKAFVRELQTSGSLAAAFDRAQTPDAAREFVGFTFDVIGGKKDYVQAAVFTFGREDLIPGMFLSLVRDLDANSPGNIATFKYYLERHIEVDGDHHSQLALEMTAALCGEDPQRWQEAEAAVRQSLQQRIRLWNGVYDALTASGTAR